MNGKKAKKLRRQFRDKFGRSPKKAEIELGVPLTNQRHRPVIQTQVDEFRKYKRNNKY